MSKLTVEIQDDLTRPVIVLIEAEEGGFIEKDLCVKPGQRITWDMNCNLGHCFLKVRGPDIEPFTMRIGNPWFWEHDRVTIKPYLREVLE